MSPTIDGWSYGAFLIFPGTLGKEDRMNFTKRIEYGDGKKGAVVIFPLSQRGEGAIFGTKELLPALKGEEIGRLPEGVKIGGHSAKSGLGGVLRVSYDPEKAVVMAVGTYRSDTGPWARIAHLRRCADTFEGRGLYVPAHLDGGVAYEAGMPIFVTSENEYEVSVHASYSEGEAIEAYLNGFGGEAPIKSFQLSWFDLGVGGKKEVCVHLLGYKFSGVNAAIFVSTWMKNIQEVRWVTGLAQKCPCGDGQLAISREQEGDYDVLLISKDGQCLDAGSIQELEGRGHVHSSEGGMYVLSIREGRVEISVVSNTGVGAQASIPMREWIMNKEECLKGALPKK